MIARAIFTFFGSWPFQANGLHNVLVVDFHGISTLRYISSYAFDGSQFNAAPSIETRNKLWIVSRALAEI